MAAGCALIATMGCGDGRPVRVPVSGHVLIDGKPLAYGYVTFAPKDSRASSGGLDKDGKFVLSCFESGDGAVTGKHRVTVVSHEPIGAEILKWHAPKKYADFDSSGLTQEITGPTDSITINLTWDGQPGPFTERH
ncbi:MAG TPA: hypothetical protein VMJ32_15410 [Pirellulales bacterium]|nr:hypothetical protein [Pirellulales bacterium]